VRFYDRREIRDLMSYLKLIANPADDEAFMRAVAVPRRGLGDATLETLAGIARDAGRPMLEIAADSARLASLRPTARQALADFSTLILRQRENAKDSAVDELLRNVIEEIRFADHLKSEGPEGMERLENVKELIAGASETVADEGGELGLTPLDHFLQHASLITDVDRQNPNADAVTMMTLHNAKGLEFPAVFITGLEDGLFPLRRAQDTPDEMEEERRLFYVGITRAMRTLYLSHARSRRRNGETLQCIPSSFLQPIPPGLVTQRASFKLRGSTRAVPTFTQSPSARRPGQAVDRSWVFNEDDVSQDAPRFVKGERVKHARFGSGTVTELSGVARDMKVTVEFDDETIGSKRLVVQYAGLERGFD
jgi:DNA helicase-2/ATP-dependent DNA helicase PcrA